MRQRRKRRHELRLHVFAGDEQLDCLDPRVVCREHEILALADEQPLLLALAPRFEQPPDQLQLWVVRRGDHASYSSPVPHERPPYERGKVDEAALAHVIDRITNPRTRVEKEHSERILTSVRGTRWWRRMLGLPPRRIVLAEPTEPESVPPQNVGDEGFFAARPDEIEGDTVENGPY